MVQNGIDKRLVQALQEMTISLRIKERKIEELEDQIKILKSEKKELEEFTIPSVMDEVGLQSVTLPTNEIIAVKSFYYARLQKDPNQFFTWLRENNFGGLIKEKVDVYPEAESADRLIEFLQKFHITFEQLSTIHWKTLEAWFKECVENGLLHKLPLDKFENYIGRKASVKEKR